MRKLTFCMILCGIYAQQTIAQQSDKSISIKVGTVYSHVMDIDNDFGTSIGYLAGLNYEDVITDHLSFTSDLYYLDQRYGLEGFTMLLQSVNLLIGTNIYAVPDRFFFTTALEFGAPLKMTFEKEGVEFDKAPRNNYVVGAGLKLDKFKITGRFVGRILEGQNGFDYSIQLGASYKIF